MTPITPAITLALPEPPSANRYWRQAGRHLYVSAEAKIYKHEVRAMLYRAGYTGIKVPFPAGTEVAVTIAWYRGRAAGDLDNRLKVTLDALRGILFDDDKQVVSIHATRHDRPRHGGLSVTVKDMRDTGPYLDA